MADLVNTADRLQQAVAELPETAWDACIRPITGESCTPRRILVIHLRELEVHHTDLALGYSFADTPDPVVRVLLDDVSRHLRGVGDMPAVELRDPDGDVITTFGGAETDRTTVTGSAADALGWLTGRFRGEGLSSLSELPTLPSWI